MPNPGETSSGEYPGYVDPLTNQIVPSKGTPPPANLAARTVTSIDRSVVDNPPPVAPVQYNTGIDANGVRYQTPIKQEESQPQQPDIPNPFSGPLPESVAGAGPTTPQSKGLSLGQANLSGLETTKQIFKQGSTVLPTDTGITIQTPSAKQYVEPSNPAPDNVPNTLSNPLGDIKQQQSTALGNGLIDLSNQQVVAKNQSIGLGNALIDLSNQQNVAKNQTNALGNGLVDLSNQQIAAKNAASLAKAQFDLKSIVAQGLIGNAKEFDIYNASGAKVGSIPANANSYNSLSTLLDVGEPLSIRAVNPQADQASRISSLADLQATKSFIQNAKESGVQSIDILAPSKIGGAFGSQGTKIGTTTPDNALRDVLGYQAKGIPVSLTYQPPQNFSATLGESGAKEIYGNPLGEFIKGNQANFNSLIGKNTGPTLSGIITSGIAEAPSRAPNVIQSLTPSFGTKTFQPPVAPEGPTESKLSALIGSRPFYALGSLAAEGGIQGLTFGGGKGIEIGLDLAKSGLAKNAISEIAAGIGKGETTMAPQTEKVSPGLYHITQGTEGRSITPTQTFQKALNIFRLPTSKIVPGFGKVATEEGKVGATEIGLPKITKPIGNLQGKSAISDVFVSTGKNGIVTYIPKTISEDVKATSVLIGKDVNPELVTRLNLKPSENVPGFFEGKLSPETRLILNEASNSGAVTKVAQGFSFPLSDVKLAPDLYPAIVKNPSLLGETGTAATEKIFPDITRPDILGIYRTESKGFGSAKGLTTFQGEPYGSRGEDALLNYLYGTNYKPVINPLTGETETLRGFDNEENIPRKNKSSKPFSLEGIGKSKIGAGASGKANSLIEETKTTNLFKDFYKPQTVQKEAKLGSYLGFTPRTNGRSKQTEETEILSFPPGTKSELTGKQIGIQGIKLTNDILQESKEKQTQAEKAGTLYKIGSELKQRQNQRNNLLSISLLKENQNSKLDQSLRLSLGSIQTSRSGQTQKNALSQITSLGQLTRQTPIQTERTGLLQGQEQITRPLQTPQLLQVPLQTTTPGNPPRTPGLGGGFNWPKFDFTYGSSGGNKRKKKNLVLSFNVYSVNPNIVGAIEQAGVQGLQVSRSSGVYQKADKQLQRATRLQFKGVKIKI